MPDSTWPSYPLAFLRNVAHCLALIHQKQLHFNPQGRLQISSLSRLARELMLQPTHPHPRSEMQAPELGFLIRLVSQAGLISTVGPTLHLSATAYKWLDRSAEDQLHMLRQSWFLTPELSWCWLPPDRRQRSLDSYWEYLLLEAAKLVATLPTTTWTPLADLTTALENRGVLTWKGAGQNLPQVRHAVQQRTQKTLRFLFQEILPRLGLVEGPAPNLTEGSKVEGQIQDDPFCVRPTPEGAAWLHTALAQHPSLTLPSRATATEGAVPTPQLRFPPSTEPPVTVQDDLHLTVHLTAPAAFTFDIAHFARLLSPGPPAHYQITRQSLQQTMTWDYPVADVIFLLTRFSTAPLPLTAAAQLEAWRQEMALIACEPGYRLHTTSPAILDLLRQRTPFRHRTQPLASGQDAWVSRTQAPHLFRYLRRLGYTLALPQDPEDDPPPLGPSRRQALPLPQLLVALRTYQHLRRWLPGLAALGLEELERDLAAALTPDDLAGVQRLVGSHLALMDQRLQPPPHPPDVGGSERGGRGEQGDDEEGEREREGAEGRKDQVEGEIPSLQDRLQVAIESGRPLNLTYMDTQGQVTHRRVHPLGLESRWGGQYFVAYCELRQDERLFRLDRIVAVDEE